jgi:hypothetical protein
MTSLGVRSKAMTALAKIQPSEPRVWVTPLAGPVEPEVKKIAAGALGSGAGSATSFGSIFTNSSKLGFWLSSPPYQITPSGRLAALLAAMSAARSVWARMMRASLTLSAWSISGGM